MTRIGRISRDTLAICFWLIALPPLSAQAQSVPEPWEVRATIHGWVPAPEGTTRFPSGALGPIQLPGPGGRAEASPTHWDAIVGASGRYRIGDGLHWFAPYYVDIGTGESKFTWQAMAGIGYPLGGGDVAAAWRYIDYEMKSGSAVEELSFNGPGLAAVFRW